jgi:hypothetical protein
MISGNIVICIYSLCYAAVAIGIHYTRKKDDALDRFLFFSANVIVLIGLIFLLVDYFSSLSG